MCLFPEVPSAEWPAPARSQSGAVRYAPCASSRRPPADASHVAPPANEASVALPPAQLLPLPGRRAVGPEGPPDHRAVADQQALYVLDPVVGAGLPVWMPAGAAIRGEIERLERELIHRAGYEMVQSPHLVDERLFAASGHLEHYADVMFPAGSAAGAEDEPGVRYRPKPMSCPLHARVYAARPRSWRDLPLRLAEFAAVYRYEPHGALHGLARVRGFVQDDAHVFCRPDQIQAELESILDLIDAMLGAFGLSAAVSLAGRPGHALGSEAQWAHAMGALVGALRSRGKAWAVDPEGGAFYGPKLDFHLLDAHGRRWQGPSVQLDWNLPERLDLWYVGADNRPHRPVMIHRALLGSLERAIALLAEHYGGDWPLWLAPVQVQVLPLGEAQAGPAERLRDVLRHAGHRAVVVGPDRDLRLRVRAGVAERVPYQVVLGPREVADRTVSVRVRALDARPLVMPEAAFVHAVQALATARADVRRVAGRSG